MALQSQCLTGWQWRRSTDAQFKPCCDPKAATSQIHLELQHAGKIPDPFTGLHELDVQWVSNACWEYQTTFDAPVDALPCHELVLEGIDCMADVYLNSVLVHRNVNAFHVTRLDVSELLRPMSNVLLLKFKSDKHAAKELEGQHAVMKAWNGDPSRVYLRKPQHQWGWDWGPTLVTSGISRGIRLESFSVRFTGPSSADVEKPEIGVVVQYELSPDFQAASISVAYNLSSLKGAPVHLVSLEVTQNGERVDKMAHSAAFEAPSTFQVELHKPKLWYPHRYGDQPLYVFTLCLWDPEGRLLHTHTQSLGLRNVELVQEPVTGESGTSFFFRVNGIPVWCGGSNWIPAHSFETALGPDDYVAWVRLMKEGNQDMVRVWGGGVYETDAFYDACDKEGVLVWQDFMFACGLYPAFPDFRRNVEREVKDQLTRLRHHCSIVIYAGNNEDYQVAESNQLWDPSDESGDWTKTGFPARTIYETDIPKAFGDLDLRVAYRFGSPWSALNTRDPTQGDAHVWDVWHGSQKPYQDYGKLASRFISEFGMQSLPHVATSDSFILDPADRFPQSKVVEAHNKADSWERRLALYVMENVRMSTMSLEEWTYLSQLVQSEALTYAYSNWRRKWNCDGQRSTAGALTWQMNDCWPCASWSIVDFYKRPKLAYYANLASLICNFDRATGDASVVNGHLEPRPCQLQLQYFDISSGAIKHSLVDILTVRPNASYRHSTLLPKQLSSEYVVYVSLSDTKGNLLANSFDWPQPLKHLKLRKPNITIIQDGDHLTISSDAPTKAVELFVDGQPDVRFSDNGFDLVPGLVHSVRVSRLKAKNPVKARYYGSAFL